MNLKGICMLCGAIGAGAIMTNKPDTDEQDPEDKGQQGISEETEFVRRQQDIAIHLANALDPSNPKHWQWPPGFEALEQSAATVASGPTGGLAAKLLPILESVGVPALTQLLQSLTKPASATPTTTLPPL